MCKHYKQPVSGNKKVLIVRLYYYLQSNNSAKIIQQLARSYLLKKIIIAKGPAFIKRELCVNDADFYTLDLVKDIPLEQFISYSDNNIIYGFDILSLHNLIKSSKPPYRNPYNRTIFPKIIHTHISNIIKFSSYFGSPIINIYPYNNLEDGKLIELMLINVFQEINNLGNYTDHVWMSDLSIINLKKFIRELSDIWNFRANLSVAIKQSICPSHGNPFIQIQMNNIHLLNRNELLKACIIIMQNMVLYATDEANRSLGANYVLCALTLVSEPAAMSLPWFYQSVTNS